MPSIIFSRFQYIRVDEVPEGYKFSFLRMKISEIYI